MFRHFPRENETGGVCNCRRQGKAGPCFLRANPEMSIGGKAAYSALKKDTKATVILLIEHFAPLPQK